MSLKSNPSILHFLQLYLMLRIQQRELDSYISHIFTYKVRLSEQLQDARSRTVVNDWCLWYAVYANKFVFCSYNSSSSCLLFVFRLASIMMG